MTRSGIVTGGTWCADHSKLVAAWPREDAVTEIVAHEIHGGGSACNFAIDMRRLSDEISVETIGIVGDDDDGRALIAEADAAGVGRARLRVASDTRTNFTDAIVSSESGLRTHLFFQGTSALLSPDLFDFTDLNVRLLHLGLPGIHRVMDQPWQDEANGWVAVLRKAKASGIETSLELCSISAERIAELVRPCLAHLDHLVVNDYEIGAIAGHETRPGGQMSLAAISAAIDQVMAQGAMTQVVVHFPGGAVGRVRDGAEFAVPSVAVPAEAIRGVNGAGDAFAAGTLCGHLRGWSPVVAVRLGHAAAAASLRSLGTTSSVVSVTECLQLAERWGWRNDIR